MIALATSRPDFFAHGGRDAVARGEGFGCDCEVCGRQVSAPHEFQGGLIWCLYCGMSEGAVPLLEHPWGHKYSFGITGVENAQDIIALEAGLHDEMAEDRARKNGQVYDLLW